MSGWVRAELNLPFWPTEEEALADGRLRMAAEDLADALETALAALKECTPMLDAQCRWKLREPSAKAEGALRKAGRLP